MMPSGGGPARAEALSVLRGLIHQHATREGLADLFAAAAAEDANLPPWQKANLREMKREWVRASALPLRLVEAMSRAESLSEQAWRELRPDNDFAGFLPFLREVIQLKREAAQAWAEQLGLCPYDALMDGFEPGTRADQIAPLFARLRAFYPDSSPRPWSDSRAIQPQPATVRFPSRVSAGWDWSSCAEWVSTSTMGAWTPANTPSVAAYRPTCASRPAIPPTTSADR